MKKTICTIVMMVILAMPVIGLAKEAKWHKVKLENDYDLYTFRVANQYGGAGYRMKSTHKRAYVRRYRDSLQ